MDYWSTTGGLALGLPISFGLAGIVQLTRWRAAKLAQPIPNAQDVDQDALTKERLALAASKGSKVKLIGTMVAFAVYMLTLANIERFPSGFKLSFWMGLSGILSSFHVITSLAQLTGATGSGLSRQSNKTLRFMETVNSGASLIMIAVSSIIMVGLAASVPFLFPGNTALLALTFFLSASIIPYRLMANMPGSGINTSAPLKWRLFGLSAFVIGFLGLMALVWGIVAAFVVAFPGDGTSSKPNTPKTPEDPAYTAAFLKILIHVFFALQFCTLFGQIGAMLLPIYRVDWILSNSRRHGGHLQLEEDTGIEVEREIFSQTRPIGTFTEDEIDKKDLGELVVVPSFRQLLARGQIGHFLARPVYTATALITVQMTMVGCTFMGKRIVEVTGIAKSADLHGVGKMGTAMVSNFVALGLMPFILTPVLALVSGLRGDFALLFNHRADWSAHAAVVTDESEPLLEDKDDEKAEMVKKYGLTLAA